ncbi:MAG: endolytic transglycosylase MltG [Mediterranea massiliensis]|nr:endolytic transglycosylase MltG [Mediterranea massiliensis]
MKKKKITLAIITIALIGIIAGALMYYYLFSPQFFPQKTTYLYIDRNDNIDSIYHKVKKIGNAKNITAFKWMSKYRKYDKHIHTGRYAIRRNENVYHVFSRLYRGYQEPTNITIGSVRTIDRLARNIGQQLMIDSIEIATLLNDSIYLQSIGYSPETIQCLFIPNTYEVYWNTSAKDFIERMQKEYNRFWNEKRQKKAKEIGLTPQEVITLASIVEEETNNNQEKPIVAGLYINRLHKGMPLQADPTIKYALGDFTLRRITNKHLTIKSAYNTYLNIGLPPGPIRIPTTTGIDAVLNHQKHDYLYMCAKEDFSGTHNFAKTLSEHNRNARKYWNALNQRKIFK